VDGKGKSANGSTLGHSIRQSVPGVGLQSRHRRCSERGAVDSSGSAGRSTRVGLLPHTRMEPTRR
jgi:hypothetical protein